MQIRFRLVHLQRAYIDTCTIVPLREECLTCSSNSFDASDAEPPSAAERLLDLHLKDLDNPFMIERPQVWGYEIR